MGASGSVLARDTPYRPDDGYDSDERQEREFRVMRLTLFDSDRRAKFHQYLQKNDRSNLALLLDFFLDIVAVKKNLIYLVHNPTRDILTKYALPIAQQLVALITRHTSNSALSMLSEECQLGFTEMNDDIELSSQFSDNELLESIIDFLDEAEYEVVAILMEDFKIYYNQETVVASSTKARPDPSSMLTASELGVELLTHDTSAYVLLSGDVHTVDSALTCMKSFAHKCLVIDIASKFDDNGAEMIGGLELIERFRVWEASNRLTRTNTGTLSATIQTTATNAGTDEAGARSESEAASSSPSALSPPRSLVRMQSFSNPQRKRSSYMAASSRLSSKRRAVIIASHSAPTNAQGDAIDPAVNTIDAPSIISSDVIIAAGCDAILPSPFVEADLFALIEQLSRDSLKGGSRVAREVDRE